MPLTSVKVFRLLRDHAGVINKMASDVMSENLDKKEAATNATQKAKDLIAALKD